jgi:hypothetical protein
MSFVTMTKVRVDAFIVQPYSALITHRRQVLAQFESRWLLTGENRQRNQITITCSGHLATRGVVFSRRFGGGAHGIFTL